MGIDVELYDQRFYRIFLIYFAIAIGGVAFFASASSIQASECDGKTGALFDCPVVVHEKFGPGRYDTVMAGVGLHDNAQTAGDVALTVPVCGDGSTPSVIKSYLHWFNRPSAPTDYDEDILFGVDSAPTPTAVSAIRTYTHDDKDGNPDRRAYVADVTSIQQGGSKIVQPGTHTYNFSGFDVEEPYGFALHVIYECADLPLVEVVYHEGNDFFWGRAGELNPPAPPEGIAVSELVCAQFDAATTALDIQIDLIIPGATPPSNAFPGRPRTAYLWWDSGKGTPPDTISTVIVGTPNATNIGKVADGKDIGYAYDIFSGTVSVPAGDEYVCVQLESPHPDDIADEYGISGSLTGFWFSLPQPPEGGPTQDWGDLPDTFDTLTNTNGPRHTIVPNMYLGSCVDAESNGSPDNKAGVEATGGDDNANSDNDFGTCASNDDEDGITLLTPLIAGNEACLSVSATTPTAAILNGWIDFNGDGDYDGDASDQLRFNKIAGSALTATTNGPIPTGTNTREYCFTVPADATFDGGETHMRFRLSTAGSLSYNGPAEDGEVEDYWLPLACVGNYVWIDPGNNDNTQNNPDKVGANGVTVDLVCAGPDNNLSTPNDNMRFSTITTSVNGKPGKYHFCGLPPAITCRMEVPTPPTVGEAQYPKACVANAGGDDIFDSDGTQSTSGGTTTGPTFTFNSPFALTTTEGGACDLPGSFNNFPDAQDELTYDFCFRQGPTAIEGEFIEPEEFQRTYLPLLRFDKSTEFDAFYLLWQK